MIVNKYISSWLAEVKFRPIYCALAIIFLIEVNGAAEQFIKYSLILLRYLRVLYFAFKFFYFFRILITIIKKCYVCASQMLNSIPFFPSSLVSFERTIVSSVLLFNLSLSLSLLLSPSSFSIAVCFHWIYFNR